MPSKQTSRGCCQDLNDERAIESACSQAARSNSTRAPSQFVFYNLYQLCTLDVELRAESAEIPMRGESRGDTRHGSYQTQSECCKPLDRDVSLTGPLALGEHVLHITLRRPSEGVLNLYNVHATVTNIRISSLVYRLRYPLFNYVSNYDLDSAVEQGSTPWWRISFGLRPFWPYPLA